MERRSQLVGLRSFKRQVLAFQLGNCCFLFDEVQVLCIQRRLWPPRWVNYRSRGQKEVRRDGGLLLSERKTHRTALKLSKNGIFRREQFCVFSVAVMEVMCPCSGIQGDAEGLGTLVLWCKR